jgi:hypothetical protein
MASWRHVRLECAFNATGRTNPASNSAGVSRAAAGVKPRSLRTRLREIIRPWLRLASRCWPRCPKGTEIGTAQIAPTVMRTGSAAHERSSCLAIVTFDAPNPIQVDGWSKQQTAFPFEVTCCRLPKKVSDLAIDRRLFRSGPGGNMRANFKISRRSFARRSGLGK